MNTDPKHCSRQVLVRYINLLYSICVSSVQCMYGYIKYRLSTFMVTLHGTFLQHISSTWIQTGVQFSGTAKTIFADLHQVGDADPDA